MPEADAQAEKKQARREAFEILHEIATLLASLYDLVARTKLTGIVGRTRSLAVMNLRPTLR